MVEVSVEREFDADADRLWKILADFGDISWIPGIEKVELEGEGVGMIRHLTVPVYPQLHERLDSIDHEEMVLEYSIPAVEYIQVEDYAARAQVFDLGPGRCRTRMTCKAEATGPEAEARTRAFYVAMLGWIDEFLKR